MNEHWYAVQTKPRQEDRVSRHLEGQHGFRVFLPKLSVAKRRRNRRVSVIETLFPTYLFVHMSLEPKPWHTVKWAPGVKSLVGTRDEPVPVPDEAIGFLIERYAGGNVIPWQHEFATGTQVRIRYGPFTGLVGIFERSTTQAERVRVLLDLLGQKVPVEVDPVDLEAV